MLGAGAAPVRVCIELDASWWAAGGRVKIGAKRSPVHSPEQALALARDVAGRPQIDLVALMAYEGQISGVGDRPPGQRLRGAAIRFMQRRSAEELAERRAAAVAAVRQVADLRVVNGGGTGSLELTAAEPAVTEVTAGSGFYAPAQFDHYSRFTLTPAAGFALPIVRRPARARRRRSAGATWRRAPATPAACPSPGCRRASGSTPRRGPARCRPRCSGAAADRLAIGDRVFMRHSKAGELCERFDSLFLIEGGEIVDSVPTYRGDGQAFL